AERALVRGQTDVLGGFEQGREEQGEGSRRVAGLMPGDGEIGGELRVIGKLDAGALERDDGLGRTAQTEEADGVGDEGVGLFGGGGEAEGEGALVTGEGLGMFAGGGEREGQFGGDLGLVWIPE